MARSRCVKPSRSPEFPSLEWQRAKLDSPRIPVGPNWPLVGKRAVRRIGERLSDHSNGRTTELFQPPRQRDYGFPPAWWAGGEAAKRWQSECFPLKRAAASVSQWLDFMHANQKLKWPARRGGRFQRASGSAFEKGLADAWLVRDLLGGKADRPAREATERFIACVGGFAPSGYSHTPDFCTVRFAGRVFEFTSSQRGMVGLLWEAWKRGVPVLSGTTLTMEAGIESRFVDVFKNHPAWNTLIIKSDVLKDGYRLALPATPSGR